MTITLDSDVAQVFSTSESVNTVLRGIIQSLVAVVEANFAAQPHSSGRN